MRGIKKRSSHLIFILWFWQLAQSSQKLALSHVQGGLHCPAAAIVSLVGIRVVKAKLVANLARRGRRIEDVAIIIPRVDGNSPQRRNRAAELQGVI